MTKYNYLEPTVKIGNDPDFPEGVSVAPVSIMGNPQYTIINFENQKLRYYSYDGNWTTSIFVAQLYYKLEQAEVKAKELRERLH